MKARVKRRVPDMPRLPSETEELAEAWRQTAAVLRHQLETGVVMRLAHHLKADEKRALIVELDALIVVYQQYQTVLTTLGERP